MAIFNPSSFNFLILVAIALFLLAASEFHHARPSSPAEASGFRAQNTLESSFRTLGTMLPKGQPVPPSGPNPQIN
ncbi:hypothetical protein V6N13_077287 [Hibiscus sabdariffa]|uniref:Uncharacterized protein n=1 Tax=Hibiscus sabdariffa TaxID=183260 RepID=A0ABR2CNQ5_9ROSI